MSAPRSGAWSSRQPPHRAEEREEHERRNEEHVIPGRESVPERVVHRNEDREQQRHEAPRRDGVAARDPRDGEARAERRYGAEGEAGGEQAEREGQRSFHGRQGGPRKAEGASGAA